MVCQVQYLTKTANGIVYPVTFCENYCMMQGSLPSCLKLSLMVPIFKKGKFIEPNNFRPTSCIPILAEVFEKILRNNCTPFFKYNNVFYYQQFVFR